MRDRISANRGFTLVELLIVIAVIAILAALAIPNTIIARKYASEGSTVGTVRLLVSAQETYRSRQNPPVYAGSLKTLYDAGLIDVVVASGIKSGYRTTISLPNPDVYTIVAKPYPDGSVLAGDRSFFADQTGVIREAQAAADGVPATPDGSSSPIQ